MANLVQLTLNEFDQRMELSQFAFQMQWDTKRIEEEKLLFNPETEWGLLDEQGRLLSALTIHPFHIWMQRKVIPMGGIANVASWPDARRQGGVSKLMVHALHVMKQNGQIYSMLAPFSISFYRKFGYELMVNRKHYLLEPQHLPMRKVTKGTVKLVKKDSALLKPMYEQYASQFNSTLHRSELWWENKVCAKQGQVAIYYNEDNDAEGYILYEVKARTLTVHEWIDLSIDAREGLWGLISNHDSMIDCVELIMPVNDETPLYFDNPRFKQEVFPYYMGRIVDVEAFLCAYQMNIGESEEQISIKITDNYAHWNHGSFSLKITEEGHVRTTKIVEPVNGLSIACDISVLTALLTGNWSIDLLVKSGKLVGDAAAIAILKRRIPSTMAYLLDSF